MSRLQPKKEQKKGSLRGKSIPYADDTYLDVDLMEGFKKLREVLRLEPATVNNRVGSFEEDIKLLARALIKLIEMERQGRPWSVMLGLLAKQEIDEFEYLRQYLKES